MSPDPVKQGAVFIIVTDLSDLSGLMISSQDCDSLAEADLEGDQEGDGLHAVVAPVHVVPHEEVVGVGGLAADAEELHQVVELAVDVSAHYYWTFHLYNNDYVTHYFISMSDSCSHLLNITFFS